MPPAISQPTSLAARLVLDELPVAFTGKILKHKWWEAAWSAASARVVRGLEDDLRTAAALLHAEVVVVG